MAAGLHLLPRLSGSSSSQRPLPESPRPTAKNQSIAMRYLSAYRSLFALSRTAPGGRTLDGNICHQALRAPIVLHADLHRLGVNLDVARNRLDQVIAQRVKLGGRHIGAVMDQDQLQAFFGALGAVPFAKQTVKEAHVTSSRPAAEG